MQLLSEAQNLVEKFFPSSYVVVDIETTGLNPIRNEIIELSALKVQDNTIVDSFTTLIKPNEKIPTFITSLTGISNEMVKNAQPVENILADFCNFVGNSVILGHNVSFDMRFIKENCKRHLDKEFANSTIDTLKISRKLLPNIKNHKLSTLADHYGISSEGHHRGLVDCEITYNVHQQLRQEI